MNRTKLKVGEHVRQGDLLIARIRNIPKAALKSERVGHILAFGEVTGHKHEVVCPNMNSVVVYEGENGGATIASETEFEVVHNEHPTIEFEKGNYEVTRQREYDPIAEGRQRQVAD